ncbi:type II secretion system F family protein [Balneolales bacterium ANBcel1]|nr:type II secretion system F family protein [Balneolales bacterium ANBcel1]
MPEFRFQGVNPQGKLVQSEFEAPGRKEAKARVEKLAKARNLTIRALEQKTVFIYKARKPGRPPVEGEQEAYRKEEVERALIKMGFKVDRIGKKWLDLKGGVPNQEVVTFIRLSSDLLRQKLPYDQILNLLHADTANKRMREVIREIQKDLRDGKEGQQVYGKHSGIFGRFAAYMLSVASTSGNMAEVFESTAKFMERDATFRKNMRRALLMPVITFIAVILVIIFYVGYIFPQTAEMFLEFDIALPPMTAATLDFSNWLKANWILVTLAHVLPIAGFLAFIRSATGRLWLDRNLLRLPVIGDLLHKTSIEIFSRVFYTLYSGSGQNIEVIRVASEACRNTHIEKRIKDVAIRMMLDDGRGLLESLEATGVFPQSALSRFRLGAESGTLKQNAYQLSEYYESQTTYKMDAVVDMVNLGINLFIMVALIGITVVSSESALIQPN